MSLYTKFCSSVVFPLHESLKNHDSVDLRRQMEESQWWSPEGLRALQLEALRDLLIKAQTRVPYYRKLFVDLRFDSASIRSLDDLARLPFLTKALVRSNGLAMRAEGATKLRRLNTGGSSGEPLIFEVGLERVSHDVAAKWRATRWWDVDIGDPEIVVWGSPIELDAQDRVRAWRDRALRTQLLPAFDLSPQALDGYLERIRAMKPRMLFGYPSALARIARHAQARKAPMNDLGIRVAFTTAERLYDDQRDIIERSFGCRVANGYGARDAGFIAHACSHGSMHITSESVIVETIDAQGRPTPRGVPGEIVVTHLGSGDFPFIRYRTGDMGIVDSSARCTCGRGLPVLKEIQGRHTDFVIASDGTPMHGLALIYVVRDLPGVKQFKIVQETLARLRVQLATDASFAEDNVQRIVDGMRKRLGRHVEVDVERVPEIAPEASGKYRYVVSKVAADVRP